MNKKSGLNSRLYQKRKWCLSLMLKELSVEAEVTVEILLKNKIHNI